MGWLFHQTPPLTWRGGCQSCFHSRALFALNPGLFLTLVDPTVIKPFWPSQETTVPSSPSPINRLKQELKSTKHPYYHSVCSAYSSPRPLLEQTKRDKDHWFTRRSVYSPTMLKNSEFKFWNPQNSLITFLLAKAYLKNLNFDPASTINNTCIPLGVLIIIVLA